MAWTIELSPVAQRELDQFDAQPRKRLLQVVYERIAKLDDPRGLGEALRGSRLGEFWKYRVGHYRLICKIEDDRLIVLVPRIGNRKEIYR